MENCTHCDEIAIPAIYQSTDVEHRHPFCCEGCLTVFTLIHQKGLQSYYEIKNNSSLFKRRSPVEIKVGQFHFLDIEDFLTEYSYVGSGGERIMEFYLEGVHCLACLWLIEKMPEFVVGVLSSKLELDRSVVTVVLKNEGSFSSVARELNQLGYRPHPLKKNQDVADMKTKAERMALVRIGVAGAAAGNIMIYAVSLYGGATGNFAQLFNALTVFFALPVLSFCAFPFYQNAWNALRNKTLSIDIPISVSLIIGALMGINNLVLGIPDNYFDSLTALVFLLLLSRYFLQKIQEKGLSSSDLHFFYQTESVSLENGNEIHPRFIKVDDVLLLRPGEFVPADGVVLRGESHFNTSLLTGESFPVLVKVGEKVFSGTQNLDHEIFVKVTSPPQESRLGRILKNVENGWAYRSKIVQVTNLVSKYFTLAVFFLAAVLFFNLYQTHDFKQALEGAMTLLIVTCPCALALAVPLTFTRALGQASQNGIIVKSDEVIEKISSLKHVFIDKTGTITHGKLKVSDFKLLGTSVVPVEEIVHFLESSTRHPVGRALLEHFKGAQVLGQEVIDFKEVIGAGVNGIIRGHFCEINRNGIFEDNRLIAHFEVQDMVRADSGAALQELGARGLQVTVLSGDKKESVEAMVDEIGLPREFARHGLSPEAKAQLINGTSNSMMIGDGANDAIALSQASVGVAVMGAMDISLRAADVYLTTPGLVPVEKLFVLSQETMKIIRRNLVLSLAYNSLSVAAVFLGIINPLVAAIIMPLSSLTVLLSTLAGTKKMRNLWKS